MSDLMTIAELGPLLGLGRDATKAGIRRGELPGKKVGERYVIRREWVEAYIAGRPGFWDQQTAPVPFRTPGPRALDRKEG